MYLQKQRSFMIIKGSIHQKAITIIDVYAPNNSAPKYMKHKLI